MKVLKTYESGELASEFPPGSIDLKDPSIIQRLVKRVKDMETVPEATPQFSTHLAATLLANARDLQNEAEVIDLTSSQEIQENIKKKVSLPLFHLTNLESRVRGTRKWREAKT